MSMDWKAAKATLESADEISADYRQQPVAGPFVHLERIARALLQISAVLADVLDYLEDKEESES